MVEWKDEMRVDKRAVLRAAKRAVTWVEVLVASTAVERAAMRAATRVAETAVAKAVWRVEKKVV